MIDIEFRTLTTWPRATTKKRQRSPFSVTFEASLRLLRREVQMLGARSMVIEIAIAPTEIRQDGMPYASARATSPAVKISFESKHGPLCYMCDACTEWQANIRAIGLTLERLRLCDSYGVTRSGEQYKGWNALPAPIVTPSTGFENADAAATWISRQLKERRPEVTCSPETVFKHLDFVYRELAKKLHPDAGGTTEDFQRLQAAKSLIEKSLNG